MTATDYPYTLTKTLLSVHVVEPCRALLMRSPARYKIISAIGVKIAKITPSRGFAIELGSAIMIIIGSRLEIPLSTTHCQVSYLHRSLSKKKK